MIDAHCHLQDLDNIDAELQRCKAAGITTVICNGYDLESSKKAIGIAEKYEGVFATVGIHPKENLKSQIPNPNEFFKLTSHKKVVAVGECGLDYTPETREKEKREQREMLKFNLELARQTKLPLVIHCRNGFSEIFNIVNYDKVQMHCFTGNMEQMQECVRRGWYMSFGGIVTFKASHDLREVVKQVPDNRLLIETDSPYISPEPVRGQRNFPVNLIYIAKLIAQLRSTTVDNIDKLTTANTYSLFPKLKLPSF